MAETENHEVHILKETHYPTSDWIMRSDGIIQISTADYVFFTLNDAKIFVDALNDFTEGIPHPVLIIPGRHMSVDNQARSFMASPEALQNVVALASLEHSMSQRVVNNLFTSIDRPIKPVKFFDDTKDAIEWLKHQSSKP